MYLLEKFITAAIPEVNFLYQKAVECEGFSIDSRTIKQGEIFVAISGSHVDGHEYVAAAFQKGAAGCIIQRDKKNCLAKLDPQTLSKKCIMLVANTKDALINLARAWRSQFSYPVVGITGSVGKTSTKETLSHILDLHGMAHIASRGNENTLIGVSLNILRMRPEHTAAIFELGINKRGEMAQLAALTQPTLGIITAIGHSHMEGLGSIADIAAEKRDMLKFFKEDNIAIINGDQELLTHVSYMHPIVKFGGKTTNQIQARKIHFHNLSSSFTLKLYREKFKMVVKTIHRGQIFNMLAAAAAAYLLGVPTKTIVQAMVSPVIVAGRFEEKAFKVGSGTVINDCYNASPESMKEALLALEHYETTAPKVAILGDMLELGDNSAFWHRQLGRFLHKVTTLKKVVLVGSLVEWTKKTLPVGLEVEHVPTWQAAVQLVQKNIAPHSVVLVKGSRGMQLNNVVDAIAG